MLNIALQRDSPNCNPRSHPPKQNPKTPPMPNPSTIINFAILIALVFFLWKHFGIGSGRSFGNKIAKHIGLRQSTFWYLIKNGAKGPALDLLKSLEQSNTSLDQASAALGPVLQTGIERLETRFGPQEIYEVAKPVVARLVALNGASADAPAPG